MMQGFFFFDKELYYRGKMDMSNGLRMWIYERMEKEGKLIIERRVKN